ncbi:MAG: SUMF1/EgtB/PvdO family nonheme iron enzyme [Candidatus Solibacter usitatus]|nr:SUMF1/EgtB/PvdO family nonheme iron enzyme [Candidatus Solibacter usitatus]
MQVQLENYLVPVDFDFKSDADAKYDAYPASKLRDKLESSGARLRILIFDACRNNPFRGSRTSTRGLASMQSDAEGTLIAFATGDGNVALDNIEESNGLFTKHLIAALPAPGLSIEEVFKKVKEDVYRASGRKQNPYTYDNIVGRYYPVSAPVKTPDLPADTALQLEISFWNSIQGKDQAALFEDYLQRWPRGQFAAIAEASLAKLRATGSPAPPPPAPKKIPESSSIKKQVNPKDGLTYVWIPPGEFVMGCSPGDGECRDDEKPAHPVRITRGFWMGQTEVTHGAYNRFARESGRPGAGGSGDQMPAVNVIWNDATAYCAWMGGRLPTEAQWEYAARAGSREARYGPLAEIAWHRSNSGGRAHEVAGKQPNAFGLHDMIGNVWEWVSDWYNSAYYKKRDRLDPQGPATGEVRGVRGASFLDGAWYLRAASRDRYDPGLRFDYIGFRCVRE